MEEIEVRFSMLSASSRHELLIILMNLHQLLMSQSNGLETMDTINITNDQDCSMIPVQLIMELYKFKS